MVLFTPVGRRDLVGGGLKYINMGATGRHVLTSRYPRGEYSGLGGGDDLFVFLLLSICYMRITPGDQREKRCL